ncbi:ERAP1-like C-terminal domain-containing protein [Nocardioides alcanivorans]|uniref:ERAP1-like C-terminal domain-containing protein n=1 Tax=Nocardioides alcanivorans TaxID=2897352 RepID=UPI001F34A749|nr:ERAP1-like C-terminal domain-containing protein [Nocardioides alcanivorans]
MRSGWHDADIDPAAATELALTTIRTEQVDYALRSLVIWLGSRMLPLHPARDDAAARLHSVLLDRAESAESGSGLQLAAFQGAVATASEPVLLRQWLAGDGPGGVALDSDLRWRLLVRLAKLGAVSVDELDDQLALSPGIQASVDHVRALAARPAPEAKAWAWRRFLGEASASNYELEAIGQGLWQTGQEHLTHGYVERYFDALHLLPGVHQGWVLGDVVTEFFPRTALAPEVLDRARHHAADSSLDATVRRRLVDAADLLARNIKVVQRWSRPS